MRLHGPTIRFRGVRFGRRHPSQTAIVYIVRTSFRLSLRFIVFIPRAFSIVCAQASRCLRPGYPLSATWLSIVCGNAVHSLRPDQPLSAPRLSHTCAQAIPHSRPSVLCVLASRCLRPSCPLCAPSLVVVCALAKAFVCALAIRYHRTS